MKKITRLGRTSGYRLKISTGALAKSHEMASRGEDVSSIALMLNNEYPSPNEQTIEAVKASVAMFSDSSKIDYAPGMGGWLKFGRLNAHLVIDKEAKACPDGKLDILLEQILEDATDEKYMKGNELYPIKVSTIGMMSHMTLAHVLGDINIKNVTLDDGREFQMAADGGLVNAREAGRILPVLAEQIHGLMRGPLEEVKEHSSIKGVTVRYSEQFADAIPEAHCKEWLERLLANGETEIRAATEAQLNEVRLAVRMGKIGPSNFIYDEVECGIGIKGEFASDHNKFNALSSSVRKRQAIISSIDKLADSGLEP